MNWERPEKGKARGFMMANEDNAHHEETAKFFMPAKDCHDIKEGLKSGSVKRQDFIVAVDNNEKICKSIKKFLAKNFDNFVVVCSNVQDVNLSEVLEGRKINFMFLDLCGLLNPDLCNWLYKSRDCFAEDCRFGLTVIAFNRASKFEPIVHKAVAETEYLELLEDLIEDSRNNLTKKIFGEKITLKEKRNQSKRCTADPFNIKDNGNLVFQA